MAYVEHNCVNTGPLALPACEYSSHVLFTQDPSEFSGRSGSGGPYCLADTYLYVVLYALCCKVLEKHMCLKIYFLLKKSLFYYFAGNAVSMVRSAGVLGMTLVQVTWLPLFCIYEILLTSWHQGISVSKKIFVRNSPSF